MILEYAYIGKKHKIKIVVLALALVAIFLIPYLLNRSVSEKEEISIGQSLEETEPGLTPLEDFFIIDRQISETSLKRKPYYGLRIVV